MLPSSVSPYGFSRAQWLSVVVCYNSPYHTIIYNYQLISLMLTNNEKLTPAGMLRLNDRNTCDTFSNGFPDHNRNLESIASCLTVHYERPVRSQFYTYHNSTDIVPRAKFWSSLVIRKKKTMFYQNLEFLHKPFYEMDPGSGTVDDTSVNILYTLSQRSVI